MFISKRKIKGNTYFYLEDRVAGKKISISLGRKEQIVKRIEEAFDKINQEKALTNFKVSKKIKIKNLNDNELLSLEILKVNYNLLKDFFPQGFKSFKEDEFVQYAQGSTSIEGNSLSLQEATFVLNKGLAVTGKRIDEIREVENMLYAAKLSVKIKDINENNIKRIHSAIMNGFDEKKPGEYRQGPMFITGSKFQPPKGELVSKEMGKLLEWYNKNKKKSNPVEMASEFHVRFEEIHPFLDGNGRTGREILNTMLCNADYPRAIINLENRQTYINLLERLHSSKEYYKFSKFVYLCLEKQAEEIKQIIKDNKKMILNKLVK